MKNDNIETWTWRPDANNIKLLYDESWQLNKANLVTVGAEEQKMQISKEF